MKKYPMTVPGHAALEAELKELKSVERPYIINAIAVAREHGDLKENAEYHAAKEKQGFIEGRIQELESKLTLAMVIDVKNSAAIRLNLVPPLVLSMRTRTRKVPTKSLARTRPVSRIKRFQSRLLWPAL